MIYTIIVGELLTNCYILSDDNTKESAVIDPGANAKSIISFIKKKSLNIIYIINTHGHPDHTGAVAEIKEKTSAKYLIHNSDLLIISKEVMKFFLGEQLPKVPTPDKLLRGGEIITVGINKLKVLHTPGHTEGGICLLCNKGFVFTGDTLFAGSIGRYDLHGGNGIQLLNSIRQKLFVLDDKTIIYPGHGSFSTIGKEKKDNPFLV